MNSISITINADSVGSLQHQLKGLLTGTSTLEAVKPAAPVTTITATAAPYKEEPAAPTPAAEEAKEPVKRGRGAAKPKAETAPAAEPAKEETGDAGEQAELTVPQLRELVTSTLIAISTESGEEQLKKAKEIIVKYGAKKQSELKTEDLPAVVAELKTLLKA